MSSALMYAGRYVLSYTYLYFSRMMNRLGSNVKVAIPLATLYGSLSSLYLVLPWLISEQGHSAFWTPAALILLLGLNIHSYFQTRRGPGYLPLGTRGPSEDQELHRDDRNRPTCQKCQSLKPHRTHHCKVCGVCVLRFDHHCVITDVCIGAFNHKAYFLYNLYTITGMLLSFVWNAQFLVALVADASTALGTQENVPVWLVALVFTHQAGLWMISLGFVLFCLWQLITQVPNMVHDTTIVDSKVDMVRLADQFRLPLPLEEQLRNFLRYFGFPPPGEPLPSVASVEFWKLVLLAFYPCPVNLDEELMKRWQLTVDECAQPPRPRVFEAWEGEYFD